MIVFGSPAELTGYVGRTLGLSDWLTVDQSRIDAFAAVTGDFQWIHVDRERARASPYGGTIAHGFLTLALIVPLIEGVVRVAGARITINYGLDKVRFIAPVPAGAQVRAEVALTSVRDVDGGVQALRTISVEIQGGSRPACVAESIVRYLD
ncbi:MaoC family dehydratase [Nocardia sp. NBC_00565]|uniref:MaoC family dehydratase n=1 Tax=Nocardia sp. NBC_00565 TaxID=2975993 RepID=UPI002E7FC9F2|nr:MaoC family dehydratase [Nocardia sp. NBC_00565]WUC05610.1 MaoC family dehydratase [Nocardia sp. NBC_00565]